MNQIKPKRLVIVFVLFLIFIAGIICLRVNELIDSRDLTVLTTVFLVGSFIAIFFEKISEITLIGNTVKLQQINEKSEQLLEQLQVEHFKLRIESAFAANNLFGGGDSVFTCRAKLFEVAKDIKDAGLVSNTELRDKILPLLINHATYHLNHVQGYGSTLNPNPLKGIEEPHKLIEAISDEVLNAARVEGASSSISKTAKILENIKIYKNLRTATKWFED
ncbi:hypothetical protein OFN07_07025 [Acinetobacter baumannii]|nr:hypothetical protein [Acinetobacter baumannii]MDC4638568.1 hypothetical protein [Acinetobacter baumannii]MDC4811652.1 hypothetical protein [Acinetobacter baumannii]MDC5173745.1 hypothetical protein [Acinetobacter baumannii]MDC5613152.1 hypothetical protein [Acinetobacter baumannii]